MPRHLIALDLDGTLLGPDGKLSPRTVDAVHAVRDEGHFVCIATGRNRGESEAVLEALDHDAHEHHHVFVGGAMVVDTENDQTLNAVTMNRELAIGICDVLEELELAPMVLQTGDRGYAEFVFGRLGLHEEVKRWHERTAAIVHRTDDLGTFAHDKTLRVGALGHEQIMQAAADVVKERFGNRVFAYRVQLANYGIELLESFDPKATKWTGVKFLADRHGFPTDDVIAVGDDHNDLPMLEHAGMGIAMGNARAAAKEAADHIIGSHAHDGLAEFLEDIADGKI